MAIGVPTIGWFPGLSDPTGDCVWPPAVVLMAYLSTARGRALLHGRTVLELGAGNGDLAAFAQRACAARSYVATDLNHRAKEMRKRFERHLKHSGWIEMERVHIS